MIGNDSAAEKRIVDELDFGARTVKRVTWEEWEFSVAGPCQIQVTNASYGHLKDDHQYTVGVAERDGLLVPSECDCPADIHGEDDCKHKLALASVGNDPVLRAAVNYPTPRNDEPRTEVDGRSVERNERCASGEVGCPGPAGDELPCFSCYGRTSETEA